MRVLSTIRSFLPEFVHATHWATFPDAESCIPDVEESASHTGDVEVISQPSANPDIRLHTLHAPVERHLYELKLLGHFPISFPSPSEPSEVEMKEHKTSLLNFWHQVFPLIRDR